MERHGRGDVVEAVLADPPAVHPGAPSGAWTTSPSCYRFLADHAGLGVRTLETGCGASTVLLARLGATHVCVTPGPEEVAAITVHCSARGIGLDRVRFVVAGSHAGLPRLLAEGLEVDVALVDGGHGWPLPVLDWFYAGSMLRRGGVLVVDDIGLPAVRVLLAVLGRDPRWRRVAGTRKWAAYERLASGPLAEDWTSQPWLRSPVERADHLRRRVSGRLAREARTRGRRASS